LRSNKKGWLLPSNLAKQSKNKNNEQDCEHREIWFPGKNMVNIAINGLGRIGRHVLKIGLERGINFVAVNDLTDSKTLAYLLKYDSIYGIYDKKIEAGNELLKIGNNKIKVLSIKEPEKLPWKKLNVDIVIESTGLFTSKELAVKHTQAGAKKVIVTAPCKGNIKTIVPGVNNNFLKKDDILISVASCTTNCLAPVVKVLHENFKIKKGLMTTVHGYTADQKLQDAPHKDLRRGRAAAENIVPTTTGASIAVTEVIPELKGKLNGMALRAPVASGSITDLTAELQKSVSVNEINNAFKKSAQKELKGILEYTEEPIVSRDIIGNSHSSIFDASLTQVIDNLVKVFAWYDNEYGYSHRVIDVVKMMKV